VDHRLNKLFITAAKELHFARAAKAEGIPRSSMIAAVKQLEENLGYPLFDYQAETTVLTPEGALFAEKAKADLAKSTGNSTITAPQAKGRAPAVKGAPRVGKRRQSR
jgi:DNA-binding transcriptional LysR family regulator